MTLVLSCLTHQFVVQVSDRRVSRIINDQLEIVDDHRNKGTLYCSEMAFAYSGLAELGQEHTDVWMMNVLALAESLNDTAHLLQRKAAEEFRRIRHSSVLKRHAFVGVGWGKPSENSPITPVRVTISNALDKNDNWLPEAKDEFEINAFPLEEKTTFALCRPIGARVPKQQFDELRRNISLCVKHEVGPLEHVRLLAEAIRRVAISDPRVGKNLIAMILPKSAAFKPEIFFFTPIHPSGTRMISDPMFLHISDDTNKLEWYAPNFVCEGNTIRASLSDSRFASLAAGYLNR
jgi:hypothetical protein